MWGHTIERGRRRAEGRSGAPNAQSDGSSIEKRRDATKCQGGGMTGFRSCHGATSCSEQASKASRGATTGVGMWVPYEHPPTAPPLAPGAPARARGERARSRGIHAHRRRDLRCTAPPHQLRNQGVTENLERATSAEPTQFPREGLALSDVTASSVSNVRHVLVVPRNTLKYSSAEVNHPAGQNPPGGHGQAAHSGPLGMGARSRRCGRWLRARCAAGAADA